MKHILRYHIRECMAESSIADIKKYCERTGCREVLLFTSSYDFQPSFIPLEELKSYADSLAGWSEILSQAGIIVNLNPMNIAKLFISHKLTGFVKWQALSVRLLIR